MFEHPAPWHELEVTQPMQAEHTEPGRPIRHGVTGYRRGCRCAECRGAKQARDAAYYAAHTTKVNARNAAWYANHRAEDLARKAAYRAAHAEQERERKAAYRAAHLEQERARHAAYYAAHKEDLTAYRAAHAEQRRAQSVAWHAAHPEEERAYRAAHREETHTRQIAWRASHPGEESAYGAAWRAAHPEEVREFNHLRRARLAGVPSERFTLADVIARDGWRCAICGGKVDPKAKGRDRKSLDHIVPISLGGPHTLANAQLAHFGCNSTKGARATIPAQLRLFG